MTLGKKDKAVIRAFTERRAADGHKLSTNGRTISGHWMGGTDLASWKSDGKIHFVDTGSRSGQTVQSAIRRAAAKNDLAPGWTRGDAPKRTRRAAPKKSSANYVVINGRIFKI